MVASHIVLRSRRIFGRVTAVPLEAIKYVFFICTYKKSEDSQKLSNLNTQGEKTTVPISTYPMVVATVTSMGVISGRYGLVSVQAEGFLFTFVNSILNSLLEAIKYIFSFICIKKVRL